MDARTALKNYTTAMVREYGPNYWEHWTEDDQETFEILARKATVVRPDDTPFLRKFKGHKIDAVAKTPAERKQAWSAVSATANEKSRIVGTLSPQTGLYDGAQPKRRRIKTERKPLAPAVVETPSKPVFSPDDVDSTNIYAYLKSL